MRRSPSAGSPSRAPPPCGAQPVREHFARAQFVEMSEEERLTRPSFEELDAGVEFTSAAFHVSTRPVRTPMSFETRYLDLDTGEIRPRPGRDPGHGLDHGLLDAFGRYGAAGRAPQRVVGADGGGPRPARGRGAAGRRRRPRHPATRSPWTDRRPPPRSSSSNGSGGRPHAQLVEDFELAAGSRGRLHLPALGPPRARRTPRSRRSRRCPRGHGRRRRDAHRLPEARFTLDRLRAGRRDGRRPASRRPHRPAPAQRRRRAELPAAPRVRPARPAVAVHAGRERPRRPAAAVVRARRRRPRRRRPPRAEPGCRCRS